MAKSNSLAGDETSETGEIDEMHSELDDESRQINQPLLNQQQQTQLIKLNQQELDLEEVQPEKKKSGCCCVLF